MVYKTQALTNILCSIARLVNYFYCMKTKGLCHPERFTTIIYIRNFKNRYKVSDFTLYLKAVR